MKEVPRIFDVLLNVCGSTTKFWDDIDRLPYSIRPYKKAELVNKLIPFIKSNAEMISAKLTIDRKSVV